MHFFDLIIFSLGVKYQGKISDLVWRVSGKTKQKISIGLIGVRSHEASTDKSIAKVGKIEGIFYDPKGKSYVVINDRLISEKESFGDMIIKKINRTSVEVVQDGQEKVLTVNK